MSSSIILQRVLRFGRTTVRSGPRRLQLRFDISSKSCTSRGDCILNRPLLAVGTPLLAVAALLSVSAQTSTPTPVSSHDVAGARTFSPNCFGCHGPDRARGGARTEYSNGAQYRCSFGR